MDSFQTELMTNIKNSIDNAITQLATSINQKYPEITTEEIEKLWNNVSHQKLTPTKTKKLDINSSNTCPYIFQKGKEGVKGCVCGAKSVKEKQYCSRHSKYEGSVREEKKLMPTPKSKKSDIKVETKQISPVNKPFDRLLFKHKGTGRLWHPSTCLVFHSAENRNVIGKIDNDTIIDLTENDIDTCKKLGFGFSSIKSNDNNLSTKQKSAVIKKDSDSDSDSDSKKKSTKQKPAVIKKDSDSDSDSDTEKKSTKQKSPIIKKKSPVIKKDSDSEDENSSDCNSQEYIKNLIPKALGIKNKKIVDESDSDSDIELDSGED